MATGRDDFSRIVVDTLAKRAGFLCTILTPEMPKFKLYHWEKGANRKRRKNRTIYFPSNPILPNMSLFLNGPS